jgi:hypothetical protein
MGSQFLLGLTDCKIGAVYRFGLAEDHMQDNYPGTAGLSEKDCLLNCPITKRRAIGGQQQGFCLAEETGGKSLHRDS